MATTARVTVSPKCYSWQLLYYHNKPYIFLSILLMSISFLAFYFHGMKHEENYTVAKMDVDKTLADDEYYQIIITFTNAAKNNNLQNRFEKCAESILKYATVAINFNIIGDTESQQIAEKLLRKLQPNYKYKLTAHSVDDVVKNVKPLVEKMQQHFSYKPGSYYNNPLFFTSPAIFNLLKYEKVIMLDSDLIFKRDILELYGLFDEFTSSQVIGIAHEQQPVYRHTFYQYRNKNPNSKVGEPPPDGLTGFNSGVLLLDLKRMASSELYLSLLEVDKIKELCDKFGFKGHLGDQDFYTLLEMEHPELFYILPCTWNRQLCVWWKQGYKDVFDLYHSCEGEINVWHGNCNTPIPVEP